MTKHKKEKVTQKNDSKSDFFDEKKSDSKNDSKKVTPNIRNGLTSLPFETLWPERGG